MTHMKAAHGNNAKGPKSDPNRLFALSLPVLMGATGVGMFALVAIALPPEPVHPFSEIAQAAGVSPLLLEVGTKTFSNSCALCHAPDATGIPRLGKPLRNSAYVQNHSDNELFDIIASGRMSDDPENTTGAAMPARGGRPIRDEAVRAVVAFLRSIQDPSQPVASVDAWVVDRTTQVAQAGDIVDSVGHELFVSSCSACHGQEGEGIPGLGKALDTSEFVGGLDETGLIKFIKMGRPIWDADNTTGLDMPPKGGNPALSEEQIADIAAYIRSIHE